jgi:hypothetical protein
MLMFPTLIAIPWRVSCCGGITAVGGKDCGGDPNDFDKWKCLCGHNKNEKMNYYYHALVDCIKRHRAHLSGSTPLWETIQTELYTTYFKGFMKVTIQTLKDRWKMIQSETRKKFDLSNGFDTHPELKPFDRLVLSLMKEIEAEESKRIVTARDSAAVTEKTNLTRSVIVPVNAKVKQVNAELYRMREKGAAETSSSIAAASSSADEGFNSSAFDAHSFGEDFSEEDINPTTANETPKKTKKRKGQQDDSTEAEVTKKSSRRQSSPTKVDPIAQMIGDVIGCDAAATAAAAAVAAERDAAERELNRQRFAQDRELEKERLEAEIALKREQIKSDKERFDRIMGGVEGILRVGAALVKDIFSSKREKRRDRERRRDSDDDDNEEELE